MVLHFRMEDGLICSAFNYLPKVDKKKNSASYPVYTTVTINDVMINFLINNY